MSQSNISAAQMSQDQISAELRRHSKVVRLRRSLARFVRTQPMGTLGAVVCIFLLLVAGFADWIQVMDPKIIPDNSIPYQGPQFGDSWYNWGSDYLGRDVFSRVVAGAQLSLVVSFTANFWGTTLGIVWGIFHAIGVEPGLIR